MDGSGFAMVGANVDKSPRQADRALEVPSDPQQLPRDVAGRVIEPESDDDEDELTQRFQKLGIKRLQKIQAQKAAAEQRKREEQKRNPEDIKCFHTTQMGERCKR